MVDNSGKNAVMFQWVKKNLSFENVRDRKILRKMIQNVSWRLKY